jgi:ABC-type branched-subunit amino acid transport system ATPase component
VLLEASEIKKAFGGVQALQGVNLTIRSGEFLGLIGPNGSGKTTLINCLTAFLRADSGEIRFENRRIDHLSTYEVARQGIGRTFQICKVFRRLTVLENLMIPGLTRPGSLHADVSQEARLVLDRVGLAHHAGSRAGQLSGGQHKLVEFAMILMLNPRLILLDEPFAGVHPDLKLALHNVLLQLNEEGRTILMVSHDMGSVFQLCQRIVVLDKGEVVADGSPSAVRDDPRLARAYLGS